MGAYQKLFNFKDSESLNLHSVFNLNDEVYSPWVLTRKDGVSRESAQGLRWETLRQVIVDRERYLPLQNKMVSAATKRRNET